MPMQRTDRKRARRSELGRPVSPRAANVQRRAQAPPRASASPMAPSPPREVHPSILALTAGFYATMLLLMWLIFAWSGQGVFVMLVATLVVGAFATLPAIVKLLASRRSGRKPATLHDYATGGMDTHTGPLSGRAALVQIVVVPALLTLCLVGMWIALALAR
jgi:hypothetical protein